MPSNVSTSLYYSILQYQSVFCRFVFKKKTSLEKVYIRDGPKGHSIYRSDLMCYDSGDFSEVFPLVQSLKWLGFPLIQGPFGRYYWKTLSWVIFRPKSLWCDFFYFTLIQGLKIPRIPLIHMIQGSGSTAIISHAVRVTIGVPPPPPASAVL